jgi:hypothetical protein
MHTMKRSDVRKQIRRLAGKRIYAVTKHGVAAGKLLRVLGQTAWLRPDSIGGKKVKTQALLPLALYDLLAVGTAPYGGFYGPYYGPYYPGGGYGGYPGAGPFYPGYGPGYGVPRPGYSPKWR